VLVVCDIVDVEIWCRLLVYKLLYTVAYPRTFFGGGGGCSTKSVEDSGQRERGSGGVSPLVRGSTQFANE
jgi:hypothetical protein